VKMNDSLHLTLDPQRLHFFDAASGAAI
jgi:hypothetical protein